MSTYLNDVPSKAQLRQAIEPGSLDATVTGSTLEFPDGDGPTFAVLMIGAMSGAVSIVASFEQSPDGSTWTTIPESEMSEQSANTVVTVSFLRDERYIRCQCELQAEEGASVNVAVLLGQAIKFL